MGIYRILTMGCIVFTLTLALSHQGRGDSVGCFGLLSPHIHRLDSRLRGNDGGCGDGAARVRHTGFKAVSTGRGDNTNHHQSAVLLTYCNGGGVATSIPGDTSSIASSQLSAASMTSGSLGS